MLNFVYILAIILELILTTICVIEIVKLDKKIALYTEKLYVFGSVAIKISKKVNSTVKNLNKFVKFVTNKNLIKTLSLVKMTIDIVQLIILLKSLNLTHGIKSINYKNIKKIFVTEITRRFIRKYILKYLQLI